MDVLNNRGLSKNFNMLRSLSRAANHTVVKNNIFQKFQPIIYSKHHLKTSPVAFYKQNLPRLPVPPLKDTIDKYLQSVIPLLTPKEFECTKAVAEEFIKSGGTGEKLQKLLEEKAQSKENWLEPWWLNTAYLGYRLPVTVHSSPGLVFPLENFKSVDEQIAYTAQLIICTMLYKDEIDNDKIPLEKMGKDPLDMGQYKKFFGTCRIPRPCLDELHYNPTSKHIIVMCNNHFFKLEVDKSHSIDHVTAQLKKALELSKNKADAIGILSSDDRENWAQSFKILTKDPANAKLVEIIQKSLFLVCLDEIMPKSSLNRLTVGGLQTIHGGGSCANGGNRWFDKTVQFIIAPDGITGLCYEHSPSEGQPIAVMVDFIINNLKKPPSGTGKGKNIEQLKFNVGPELKQAISQASKRLDELVADFDLICNEFKMYGKNFIKSQKLSPDSYIQMAMQLAYYRMYNRPAAHYESAATRKYIGGRTETIRSCSVESVKFAKSMLDSSVDVMNKRKYLTEAINSHKKYTMDAVNGFGVDRHFLGLKLIAKENDIPLHDFFKDPAFGKSVHYHLTSSQVATKCPGFMCYGAVVPDGYALCYNPRDDNIFYGVSCFHQGNNVACKLLDAFELSLKDMHDVLVKSQKAKL